MNKLTLAVLITIMTGCTSTNKPEVVESIPLPVTCDGAAEEIASELDKDSVEKLKTVKREDLIQFHFSWGMGIRNSFGLWAENSPIRKSCAKENGDEDMHPDGSSTIIMQKVWDIINKST